MACDGCPEFIETSKISGLVYLVYSGGPPSSIFASVKYALADDDPNIIRKWSKPQIHKDGVIEYDKNENEPPKIEGYKTDPLNPQRLKPCWLHCLWRTLRVWRADNGSVAISAGCLNPASGFKSHETLTQNNCETCSTRLDH